ncbi:glycosyltransferase [Rubrolithibacter danxiaensis]|uniref:glycosyltransferase n=1 Tax=Rubrolithibacter danxiaensis TaxID=3390805 RepID=UPI003BF91327
MKVGVIVERFPNISETFILNHITGLIDAGIEVKIFSVYNPKPTTIHHNYFKYNLKDNCVYDERPSGNIIKRSFAYLFIAVKVLFNQPKLFLRLLFLKDLVFKKEYLPVILNRRYFKDIDVIHAHFGPIGNRCLNLKKLGVIGAHVPLVCSFHGYDIDHRPFRTPHFYDNLFVRASCIIANTNYTKSRLIQLGCNEDKIETVSVGLYTSCFKPLTNKKAEGQIVVTTVARLIEVKGIEYSILAINELVKKGTTHVLYSIIGDGPLKGSLQELVKKLQLGNYVTFLGSMSQDSVINQLNISDLFLLTGIITEEGRQETQGLVIQEAQAMKLPVIVSRTGGVPEGVLDERTGFVVEPKDFVAIAEKLELLVKDQDLRTSMGENGRKFVKGKYENRLITGSLLKVYERTLVINRLHSI